MDRRVELVAWLLVAIACLIVGRSAHAIGTVTQTGTTNGFRFGVANACNPASACPHVTQADACAALVGLPGIDPAVTPRLVNTGSAYPADRACEYGDLSLNPQGVYDRTSTIAYRVIEIPTCPSGATATGSVCACGTGYRPNSAGTACQSYGCTVGEQLEDGVFNVPTRSSSLCVNGCTAQGSMAATDGSGQHYAWGPFVGTGQTCNGVTGTNGASTGTGPAGSSEATTPPVSTLPPGQCPGTVNGQTILVPCDRTSTQTNSTGSSSSTSSGGTTTQGPGTTGTSETTCDRAAGTCTTTQTNTTTNPDGTRSTSQVTSVQQLGEFCAANRGNAQCTGEEEGEDPCEEHPERAGCKPLGTPTAGTDISNSNVPVGTITPVAGFGPSTAACPPPRTVTLIGGLTLSLPFDLLCQLANGIRPVVIGLAWLSAILAFMGLSRKGDD